MAAALAKKQAAAKVAAAKVAAAKAALGAKQAKLIAKCAGLFGLVVKDCGLTATPTAGARPVQKYDTCFKAGSTYSPTCAKNSKADKGKGGVHQVFATCPAFRVMWAKCSSTAVPFASVVQAPKQVLVAGSKARVACEAAFVKSVVASAKAALKIDVHPAAVKIANVTAASGRRMLTVSVKVDRAAGGREGGRREQARRPDRCGGHGHFHCGCVRVDQGRRGRRRQGRQGQGRQGQGRSRFPQGDDVRPPPPPRSRRSR